MQITIFSLPIFVAMVFQFAIDYLKHRLTANSRHGTHSPFVYKLTDEVIYDFSKKKEYEDIETQRKKLLNDDKVITVTDLSTGSHQKKSSVYRVSQIAKNILKSPYLAQLIYRFVVNLQPTNIMELGTSLGITTSYLAKAQSKVRVLSIEACPETVAIAQQNFEDLGLTNIDLQTGYFDDLLPEAIDKIEKLDFVYADGNYNKEETLNYFNWCLPKTHEKTLLIFADIYKNEGMKEVWSAIKNHPEVTVTIDLFWIGLVYFKKGQAKEHFKLKF